MALSPRVIGWKQFFEDLDVHEAFPVTHLPDVLIELFKVRDPVALDFSGIDQLSDEVFFVFKTSLQVWQKGCVVSVDCSGCSHLTDNGIELLAESFPNLENVSLDGCVRVSERALYYLQHFCSRLSRISARGCAVTTLPLELHSRLTLELSGCPLYRPLANVTIAAHGTHYTPSGKLGLHRLPQVLHRYEPRGRAIVSSDNSGRQQQQQQQSLCA